MASSVGVFSCVVTLYGSMGTFARVYSNLVHILTPTVELLELTGVIVFILTIFDCDELLRTDKQKANVEDDAKDNQSFTSRNRHATINRKSTDRGDNEPHVSSSHIMT
jgi:hypothetical protein